MANLRTNNLSGEQGQNAYRGSVFFHGGGQIDVTSNSDFAVGTGAYTAELWFHSGLNSGENSLFGTFTASNFGFGMWHNANNLYFEERQNAFSGDNPRIIYDTFEEGHWYHLAMCRDSSSGTLRAYVNGVQIGSTTSNLRTIAGTAPTIGENNAAANQCKGYISNIRFSNTELYPSGTTFTPPTSELTADASTILLACQNSDDPTQEETGKTLTNSSLLSDQPKVIPPYGVDAGNTFGGPIQQSSEGYMYFPTGRTEERGGGIGIVGGGFSAATSPIGTIESIRIQTMGNSITFGTLNAARFSSGVVASTSRVIFGGGYQPSNLNSMEFVNPITQGNGTDAGDLSAARKMPAGLGNSTRGIFAGGREPGLVNTIEFVTIASLGDVVNFGDLTSNTQNGRGCASPTRGIINCAAAPSSRSNVINFITISSAGDAQDFGDMTEAFGMTGFGLSDNTRGVIGGYYTAPSNTNINTINFVTIATTGDATDFGDMVTGTGHGGSGFSDRTRGVITGQYTNTPFQTAPLNSDSQGAVNLIQMITVQTTGNATDFGDLTANVASLGRKYYANGNSNSHGGLT